MATTNDKLFDSAVNRAMLIERLKKSQAKEVNAFIRKNIVPGLRKTLADIAIAEASGASPRFKKARIAELQRSVQKLMREEMVGLEEELTEGLTEIAIAEAKSEANRTQTHLPGGLGLEVASLSEAAVERTVRDLIVHGDSLATTVRNFGLKYSADVSREFGIGITSGESVRAIGARLASVTDLNIRNAQTLARTATNAIANAVREETYLDNQDLIKGVRWVSTLDLRTSSICKGRDGQVFPVGEGPRPPAHPNCRSTTVPIVKSWQELGIDRGETDSGTRASLTGKVPATQTYQTWLKAQPREIQNEALGEGKAILFRKGEIDVQDLTDPFGKEISLAEFKKM